MTKPHRLTVLGIALAVTVFSSACNKTAQGPNDQQIVTSIQAKLYQNQTLKALPVNVTVEHGVVTLKGTVNAPLEKLAVDDIAEKTAGVKQVVDNIEVTPKSPAAQTSSATIRPAAPPKPASSRRHRRRRVRRMADAQSHTANAVSQGPDQIPNSALEGSEDNSQLANQPPSKDAASAAPDAVPAPPAASAPATAPAPQPASAPPAPTPPAPPPNQVTIPADTI
ncbi:MAG: BON domain-containing protein, partial [Terriglobia bacterium]